MQFLQSRTNNITMEHRLMEHHLMVLLFSAWLQNALGGASANEVMTLVSFKLKRVMCKVCPLFSCFLEKLPCHTFT